MNLLQKFQDIYCQNHLNLKSVMKLYVLMELYISKNSRKLYVADLANDVHCSFSPVSFSRKYELLQTFDIINFIHV